MPKVYLLLGGNIGNVRNTFQKVISEITSLAGEIKESSSCYLSDPWGFIHKSKFLNQVLLIDTRLSPEQLLDTTQKLEYRYGRRVKNESQARTIDIDILFYDNVVLTSENLILPHPRLHMRKFTLLPLYEIAPELFHPVLKLTIQELLVHCKDESFVTKLTDFDKRS